MRIALFAVLAALLLLPAGAVAQSAPFQPLPAAPPDTPIPTQTAPKDDSGISGTGEVLIIGLGLLFVVGVGVAIALDARRSAPADPRPGRRGFGGSPGEGTAEGVAGERKRRDAQAQRKQKAAAKRARQARKKNRPVRK